MEGKNQYQFLMSEIIAKQSVILGAEMAVMKAKNISGLTVDKDGKVTDISGDPKEKMQELIEAYVALSGQIVMNTLAPLFSKYPDVEKID